MWFNGFTELTQDRKMKLDENETVHPSRLHESHLENISTMSQIEMARLYRFAPSGHIYFDKTKPYYAIFKKRFDSLGGFTPAISKSIGW